MAEAPVLVEIERMLDKPLHETFELVYGTSTGAIIASMVALGDDVAEIIHNRYFKTRAGCEAETLSANEDGLGLSPLARFNYDASTATNV